MSPNVRAALDDFYARYARRSADRRQVAGAAGRHPGGATLDRVKALTAHPAFSFANPNRVRALIGSFAMANQTQFNRADGAGYDFIVDTVLALDPQESAGRGAPPVRAQELARARAGAPRARAGSIATRRKRSRRCPATSRDIVDRALGGKLGASRDAGLLRADAATDFSNSDQRYSASPPRLVKIH